MKTYILIQDKYIAIRFTNVNKRFIELICDELSIFTFNIENKIIYIQPNEINSLIEIHLFEIIEQIIKRHLGENIDIIKQTENQFYKF